jgi:hypothetical protein
MLASHPNNGLLPVHVLVRQSTWCHVLKASTGHERQQTVLPAYCAKDRYRHSEPRSLHKPGFLQHT